MCRDGPTLSPGGPPCILENPVPTPEGKMRHSDVLNTRKGEFHKYNFNKMVPKRSILPGCLETIGLGSHTTVYGKS